MKNSFLVNKNLGFKIINPRKAVSVGDSLRWACKSPYYENKKPFVIYKQKALILILLQLSYRCERMFS